MSTLAEDLAGLSPSDPQYASQVVASVLAAAQGRGASDVHLTPAPGGLELKFRLDGVLRPVATFPPAVAVNIVTRLKVLANLLTYHTDRPQEGRIRSGQNGAEMRVSTFPTLHGERAVVRLFGACEDYRHLDQLGLPETLRDRLGELLAETSGAIIVSGPAGSGKTTTLYACLRELARQTGAARSLVSLEDPIEVAVEGVAQSQVNAAAGLDLATGLRFLMRQDPEVIMVGEVRDRATAEAAFQASLTGHLLLTSFHAGSAAETIGRLLDMGVEPYVLRSGTLAILCQRLVRRLCPCARDADDPGLRLGLPVEQAKVPVGCEECLGTGYSGRRLLGEMLTPERSELGRAILSRSDAAQLEQRAIRSGMVSRWQRACQMVEAGVTSPAEVRRVLGFSGPPAAIGSGGDCRQP